MYFKNSLRVKGWPCVCVSLQEYIKILQKVKISDYIDFFNWLADSIQKLSNNLFFAGPNFQLSCFDDLKTGTPMFSPYVSSNNSGQFIQIYAKE